MDNWQEVSGEADSNEQVAAKIKALLRERSYCEQRKLPDRLAAIDAELRRLGHEGAAPAKRAERRPAVRKAAAR